MAISFRSYEELLEEALAYGAARGVDTRQGSIYYDAVAGHCLRTAKFYEDLRLMADLVMIDTATEEQLDQFGKEYGMTRIPAAHAKLLFLYEGTEPPAGSRFLADSQYYILGRENDVLYLNAEKAGAEGSNILPGTPCIPFVNVKGLTLAYSGDIVAYGLEKEEDEAFRQRIREKVGGPAENGNKQHYKTWCEEVPGVGRARVFPLWAGQNTVKAVIFDKKGRPPLPALVEEVQNYIDPVKQGFQAEVDGIRYQMGDGLGEGAANLGAHFLAVGAKEYQIDVSFTVKCRQGGTKESVLEEACTALEKEFAGLVLEGEDSGEVNIRYNAVGSLINGLPSVYDYDDLKLNGQSSNIPIGSDSVPILGEVTVDVSL